MPSCCFTGCRNRGENGFRFYRIPAAKNDDRPKAWIAFINRVDLPERALLCEAHFEHDQFELNRLDNRKLLKKSAIPTIAIADFPRNQGIKRKLLDPTANATTSPIVTNQDQEHLETNSALYSGTSNNYIEQNVNDQLKCLQNELRAAKAQILAMKKQISNLEENFKFLFSEDQIHLLTYGNHRGKEWSNETIQKSLKLYMACGSKGYEELIRQTFPLPSIRTLQLRIENLKFKPSLLDDVFELLKLKVATFEPHSRHAALLLDEMAIKPMMHKKILPQHQGHN